MGRRRPSAISSRAAQIFGASSRTASSVRIAYGSRLAIVLNPAESVLSSILSAIFKMFLLCHADVPLNGVKNAFTEEACRRTFLAGPLTEEGLDHLDVSRPSDSRVNLTRFLKECARFFAIS